MWLTEDEQAVLAKLAKDSIVHGLNSGRPLKVDLMDYPQALSKPGASFVTLERQRQLRGCIGMLEAVRPLAQDVAENAYAAAFSDRRFQPLDKTELADLDIHISILSPAEQMHFASEQDLLKQLRPGIDGLIIQEGGRRATFLPSVWESLPSPAEFLQHLKQKAGLPAHYWSENFKAYRYTTDSIG